MTPDRWERVKEIFQAAVLRAPAERAAFVAEACGKDESLLREVNSLLASHDKTDSFIESPAYERAASAFASGYQMRVGQLIGHYKVVSPLGHGGMGEVHLAHDTKLDRKVALKILPAELAADRDRMERFIREAKAAAALNHPNIATIYEIGESSGVNYISMEFIDGGTLQEKIYLEQTDLRKVLRYLQQVAEGLAKAHAAGIVHRDLKPDNIMITRDDYAKILDFGLAKLIEPRRAFDPLGSSEIVTAVMPQKSIPGMVMGTVGYMSPEQATGRVDEIDYRSDIFSFGCVLFEAATGQKPFEGKDVIDSLHKIVHASQPNLKDLNPLAPEDLERITRRCLAKEPQKRYQSIREVAIELDEVRQQIKGETRSGYSSHGTRQSSATSSATRADEGFWIAVLPFKYRSSDVDLEALADGLSEEIVTGLARFSYLRVIARSSTLRFRSESADIRRVGEELGARYVMEGSLRLAGSTLRVAVQLVDATSGAHLWAETYDRPFSSDQIFAIQDNLVPRIVSTVADQYGILPHSICEANRGRRIDELSPYEALMRFFDYTARFSPESHAETRASLEQVVQKVSSPADCWAMLSDLYADEHKFGFNPQPDSLGRAFAAARRAVDLAPSNSFAHLALAQALFFRKEFDAFRTVAERAMALNPLDASTTGYMGNLIGFMGDWERGCELIQRAIQMNPHHPGWYWCALVYREYLKGNYRGALDYALKINLPGFVPAQIILTAVYGQLGDRTAAVKAREDLVAFVPVIGQIVRAELSKWYVPDLVDGLIDGLRLAGLEVP